MKGGPNRERALGRLLGRPLGAGVDSAPGACPDAETLAAWVGGGLTTAQRTGTEAHVADCDRCQALLATMARMPSALPVSAPRWSVGRALAWLVPLTVGTAAIALWVWVQPSTSVSVRPRMPVSAESPISHAQPPDAPPSAAVKPPPQVAEQRRADAPAPLRDFARNGPRDFALPKKEREMASDRDKATERPATAMKAPATAASEPVPPATVAAAPAPVAPPIGEAASVAGDASRTAAVSNKTFDFVSRARAESAKTAAVDIATPERSVRWRVTGGRLVQRSTDGGSNWETQSTGVTTQLTAGASPAPSVCWLVGRSAVVLLSTDGHSWSRLAFPEAVDLIAVQAVDATTASVTTADGRTFTTRDGGSTWVAPPLQESSATPF